MRPLAWITATLLLLLPACASGEPAAEPSEVAAATSPAPSPTPALEPSAEPSPTAVASAAPAPSERPSPAATSAPPAASGPHVELWFLRDRPRFTLEPELHRLPAATQAVARETMELLVAARPRDPALDNVIPRGTKILDVSLRDETLTVDVQFPSEGLRLGAGYEASLFTQIIHTGAQFETVERVLILEEGRTPATPHGVILDEPRDPDEDQVSPVVIIDPRHGDAVDASRVTVRGTANVYEATVVLRLVDPSGKTVKRAFATATCGTGCRGDWEHTFRNVTTPGTWKVVAAASDPSDGEGPPPYRTKRTFVVE